MELRQEASDLLEYSNAKLGRVTRYLGFLADRTRKLGKLNTSPSIFQFSINIASVVLMRESYLTIDNIQSFMFSLSFALLMLILIVVFPGVVGIVF